MNSEQCRAGRKLLGLTQDGLAVTAGVSQSSVSNCERGLGLNPQFRAAIRAALEAQGVEFIKGNTPSVRLGSELADGLEGADGAPACS